MYAQSLQRKAGQKSPNYICGTYHKGRGCGYCSVPQSAILRALAESIRKHVLGGSRKALEDAISCELKRRSESASRSSDSSSVSKQLARLDRQIDQAAERLVRVDDSIASKVEEKLLDLKRQRDELARSLSATPKRRPDLDPKKVAAEAWRLVEVFEKSSPARLRNELSKVLDRVVLEFRPGEKHGRGQSYEFVRASAILGSKELASPGPGR